MRSASSPLMVPSPTAFDQDATGSQTPGIAKRWPNASTSGRRSRVRPGLPKGRARKRLPTSTPGDRIGTNKLTMPVFLVSAKEETQGHASTITSADSKPHLECKYSQPVRYLAKIGMVVVLVSVPGKVVSLADEVIPLPATLYGYLVDARTGQSIADARVRVVSADGTDITQDTWLSDSEGFYIVRTTRRAYRNDRLLVTHQDCTGEQSFRLRRADEWSEVPPSAPKEELRPIFRHVLNCGGGK
jgi:hypothetical protein